MNLRFETGQSPKLFINVLLAVLCLSIVLGQEFGVLAGHVDVLWMAAGISFALCGVLLWKDSNFTWLALVLAVFFLGLGRFYALTELAEGDIAYFEGKKVQIEGALAGNPRITVDDKGKLKFRYEVEVQNLTENGALKPVQGKILLYANQNSLDWGILQQIQRDDGEVNLGGIDKEIFGLSGDKIAFSGEVRRFHDYGNPGRMKMALTYASQGITAQMLPEKYSLKITPQEADWLARLAGRVRDGYKAYMEKAMSKEDSAAIFAMLFGGYQGIKPELLESFTTVGLVHILSVSGSHITLMAGTAGIIGRLLHLPPKITAGLAVATILFYSLLAGAIPPVIRSAIMGLLTVLALTLKREKDAQHILGLTAFGMLIYLPLLLYDISFQLSFGAAAGLLYIAPPLQKLLRPRMPRFVADSLAVTIGAQFSVVPIIAWYFNVISISSLAANLIIAPIVEWIIAVGLLAGLLASLIPLLGHLIFVLTAVALGLVYEMSRQLAALPGSKVYMPSFSWWGIALYYALLLYFIAPQEQREKIKRLLWAKKRRLYLVSGTGIVLVILLLRWVFFVPAMMQVHFVDVGQGDAALVITPHGHAFMVDTGGVREGGYDIGKMVDVPYLLHYGVRRLDYIFLTHAHDDHAAGVKGIIGRMPVQAIMVGHEGAGEYLKTFGTGDAKKIEKMLIPLQENSVLDLDGVKIEVLYSPDTQEIRGSNIAATGNEYSNLFRISYGKASFLLTGDLVAEQEAELLRRGVHLQSTVLKVGHHGSRSSSSEQFLRAVAPQWAVISCGYKNSFGHPHEEIMERLGRCTQAAIMRTDEQGAIWFVTDGEKIKVEHYR